MTPRARKNGSKIRYGKSSLSSCNSVGNERKQCEKGEDVEMRREEAELVMMARDISKHRGKRVSGAVVPSRESRRERSAGIFSKAVWKYGDLLI
jgi:hypothetical protein